MSSANPLKKKKSNKKVCLYIYVFNSGILICKCNYANTQNIFEGFKLMLASYFYSKL